MLHIQLWTILDTTEQAVLKNAGFNQFVPMVKEELCPWPGVIPSHVGFAHIMKHGKGAIPSEGASLREICQGTNNHRYISIPQHLLTEIVTVILAIEIGDSIKQA